MAKVQVEDLLLAGSHFGHLTRRWDPKMRPYIFMERNGIHIIDLNKTIAKIDEAASAMKQIAKSGKKILLVATKKQAKDIMTNCAQENGNALHHRALAGRHADQFLYHPQERKEDEQH